MNLALKMRAEYREQPMKSPRHMTPQNLRRGRGQEGSELKAFIRAYRKEVELPINFESSIFQSRTPQRCLQHNHVITLYCVQDKKPLCAQCMYQPALHGKHEVVPLAKATAALREELTAALSDIHARLLPALARLLARSQANLEQLQREMAEVVQRVDAFWAELAATVSARRAEQATQCQALWTRLRHEYSTLASELIRINQYMNDRLKDLAEKNSEEHLLYSHNVVMCLRKMDGLIAPPFGEYQRLANKELFQRIDDAAILIKNAIAFPTNLLKEDAIPPPTEKQPSQSLKKEKMHWMAKRAEGASGIGSNDKAKISSPRSPKILANTPVTHREFPNQSPKKETTCKFFRKDKSVKEKIGFEKTLKNRKSESNMFFAQR